MLHWGLKQVDVIHPPFSLPLSNTENSRLGGQLRPGAGTTFWNGTQYQAWVPCIPAGETKLETREIGKKPGPPGGHGEVTRKVTFSLLSQGETSLTMKGTHSYLSHREAQNNLRNPSLPHSPDITAVRFWTLKLHIKKLCTYECTQ